MIVEALVEDIKTSFLKMSNSASSSTASSASSLKAIKNEAIICSSPHPFIAPSISQGKIDIPSHWRSTAVIFHDLCATPSRLASLHFFKSLKDLNENQPSHSFHGNMTTGSFRSFVLTDIKALYYRFGCTVGSDRSVLNILPHKDAVIDAFDGSVCVGEVPLAMSCDEDDSLFNLFLEPDPSDPSVPRTVTVQCDCLGVTSGAWYFEVLIDDLRSQSQGYGNSIGIASVTTVGEDGKSECISLHSDGTVVDSSLKDNAFGKDESINPKDDDVWRDKDVIGCLFEIIYPSLPSAIDSTPTHCGSEDRSLRVWFHRNGNWSSCTERLLTGLLSLSGKMMIL